MLVDLVFKDCKVVTSERVYEAGVAVDEGRIVAIAHSSHLPEATRVIEGRGRVLMPGVIDPHVHFGIYNTFAEDLRDSTPAQAVGGVTTAMTSIADKRPYKEHLPIYAKNVESEAFIDVAFFSYIMYAEQLGLIPEAFEFGVTSFKHFLNRPEYAEMFDYFHPDNGQLMESFELINEFGGVAMVHCEDYEISRNLVLRLKAQGRVDSASWNDCRPDYCEHLKLVESALIAEVTGCPLYVVHTTVGTSKEVWEWTWRKGVEMYLETCPAYLTQTKDNISLGVLAKVDPPIRTRGHVELLWHGIREGWISCVGTDHCALPRKRKVADGNIWNALLGYPGSETLLPVLISEGHNKRGIPLETIAATTATNTARILGIPNKGSICVGYDADLVLVDLEKQQRADEKTLRYSKYRDFSLFEGWTFTGYPVLTVVRGEVVAEDGEVVGKRGHGKYIRRLRRPGVKKRIKACLLE